MNLETLESRRIKADIILFYKVINNLTNLNIDDSYKFVDKFRGHNFNLFHMFSRTDIRKFSWANRIVNVWNNIESEVVNAISLYRFKKFIKKLNFKGRGSFYCTS